MFKDLRNIMLAIARAIVAMKDITSVILFVFMMYAVIGLQVRI